MARPRRLTLGELRYRKKPSLTTMRRWSTEFSRNMLVSVWNGFDLLRADVFTVDPKEAEDDLERSITEMLEPRIKRFVAEHAPYYFQHATAERESRSAAPAQPPLYDLAFVFWEDETFKWPLEAKVLKSNSETAVADYVNSVSDRFLTFKYAPFASEAAMLGYLLSGRPDTAFKSIAKRGAWTLKPHPDFSSRDHRTSEHTRIVPPEKIDVYPSELRCHHLIMPIEQSQADESSATE